MMTGYFAPWEPTCLCLSICDALGPAVIACDRVSEGLWSCFSGAQTASLGRSSVGLTMCRWPAEPARLVILVNARSALCGLVGVPTCGGRHAPATLPHRHREQFRRQSRLVRTECLYHWRWQRHERPRTVRLRLVKHQIPADRVSVHLTSTGPGCQINVAMKRQRLTATT